MMKLLIVCLGLLFALSVNARVIEVKKFSEIWEQFFQKSLQQKSLSLEKESTELSLARSKRHWLPRAYLGGQWFSTNDPTQVFFTNLAQRSIEQGDFMVSDLNKPGRFSVRTATLGLDLPLYEGGAKSSQTSMFEALVKASQLEMMAKKSEEYSELSRQYGNILIHSINERHLTELKNNLEKIISNYQVGSQKNPVGYSGLLGLKGVKNRIDGLLFVYDLKISQGKNWISTKSEHDGNWVPDLSQKLEQFLFDYLRETSPNPFSSLLMANEFKVKSLDDVTHIEKSRYLPRLGFFANHHITSGTRDSANAQAYGLYLMWDLFNSDSYGRVGEAQVKALAAKAKIESGKQEEKIMLAQLLSSKDTLQKNLSLLENSDSLLREQSLNAVKLFRSGMLSALQLAEVINRRVDLLENKNMVEIQYLDVYSRIYQLNN